ncbi:protein tramtrack, alpha isoform-like isoform X2 [Penaeus japonicus]|uniref:protein tramtrack, alpha isoform-like isoform X2 n=1 Tax=Penaeus japonicus TaxID=27405 RepID=UPI001C7108CB|nr:protein tramtrack, alpha isoform-like isoform X2 [Penaeus japonicus]
MLNSDANASEEGGDSPTSTPLSTSLPAPLPAPISTSLPTPPLTAPLPTPLSTPLPTSLPTSLQHDAVSLAHLHILNAYRWTTPAPSVAEEEYRVRWEGHGNHLAQHLARLEQDPASADATLATKGASFPAHRIVLAAASSFFRSVLQNVPVGQHPVVVVRGAQPRHLRYILSFCYTGAVDVPTQELQEVLKLAEDLDINSLRVDGSSAPSSPAPTRLPTPASHRSRFTFTPPAYSSSPSTPTQVEGSPGPKRPAASPSLAEEQLKKRFKGESLPAAFESDLTAFPQRCTPPASAPPQPRPHGSLFFSGGHPSPPRSAPPLGEDLAPSDLSIDKEGAGGVSLVPPSRLLHPNTSASNPASPRGDFPASPTLHEKRPFTSSLSRSSLHEPLTPSTPSTPTTPNLPALGTESTSGTSSGRGGVSPSPGSRVLLWRFLLDLLHNPRYSPIYIRWLDRPAGIFRIMESDMVAQLWGMARKNNNMNYEKMSRGMRTYYKRGILFHIDGTKLIYKFNTSEPEIQQRMRYYDLTQTSQTNSDSTTEQSNSSLLSPSLSTFPSLQSLPSLPTLPVAVTSAASSIDNLYSPLLRDQLHPSLLYEPYMSLFRASQRELF